MATKQRRSGPRPVERIWTRGVPDLAAPLAEALALTSSEDRWTHGFHTYPAGLPADATRLLLEQLPDGPVLDPFCGGGTVLVEAQGLGREAHGADLSPVAHLVSETRVWRPGPALITTMRSTARKLTAAARSEPVSPQDPLRRETADWYEPHVMAELEVLRRGIVAAPEPVRGALACCLSSLLIKVSHRASDTSQQRVEQRRPHGTTAVLFHKKVRELGRRLESYLAAVPAATPQATAAMADARTWEPPIQGTGVLTSPPYPGVYDYVPLQALRVAWLGLDDTLGRRLEIASRRGFRADRRRALTIWRKDSQAWLGNLARAVAPGGRAVVVIGDGQVGDKHIDALKETASAAEQGGWRPLASASGERPDPGRRSQRQEHVLLLERA
jgi:hypothetical protein